VSARHTTAIKLEPALEHDEGLPLRVTSRWKTLERDWPWIMALAAASLVSALVGGLVVHGLWSVATSLMGSVATSVIGLWAFTRIRHERVIQ
jgi:hypothetical protein